MTDLTFVPLLEAIAEHLPTVERYIVLTDAAHMPPQDAYSQPTGPQGHF